MIEARGLAKSYGEVKALRGLDLTVPEGTVLGLLGPNGAGKTTAVRILTTLLTADEGRAMIAGADVMNDPQGVRKRIGLSGQYAAVDEYLTGFENLDMVGRLYGLKRAESRQRARDLLDRFNLADAGDRPAKTYSGGMRRRLDLAGALVARPPVIVLDEPTTGLAPRSRQGMWSVIQDLVADGSTLLLTTQYLEEADLLADHIVVIDHGRAIAEGTADELKAQFGGERIQLVVADARDADTAAGLLTAATGAEVQRSNTRTLSVAAIRGLTDLSEILTAVTERGINLFELGLRRPTLDDVFLQLTGHPTEDDEVADGNEGVSS